MTLSRARLAAGALTTCLLVGASVLPALTPASAEPLGDAKHRAAVLRTKVDALRHQAEVATEEYNQSYAELGAAVTAHLTAQKDLAEAEAASAVSGDAQVQRVRALYMGGGAPALYAQALDAGSVSELAHNVHQVNTVLDGDRRALEKANTSVARREDAVRRLAAAAERSTRLQKVVAARADAVRDLLAETDVLLAQADARVRQIADEQRRAAEAAAAARAAAAFANGFAGYSGLDLPAVDASPQAAAALAFARAQLGKPYLWGATGPDSFDCSGLTGAAYRAAGVALGRTSRQQWYDGPHVALDALEPGDLLFWADDLSDPSSIHHVAMYAGEGLMVAAPKTGDVVKVQPVYLDGYIGAVRPGGVVTGG